MIYNDLEKSRYNNSKTLQDLRKYSLEQSVGVEAVERRVIAETMPASRCEWEGMTQHENEEK